MNIEIPDIPKILNPNGWEVEVSSIGECKEGDWPFYLSGEHWYIAGSKDDAVDFISARLIEPKYQDCICLGFRPPTAEMEECINEMMRPTGPTGPANLPTGHKAYPVVMDDTKGNRGLCVMFNEVPWPVYHCGNGMTEDGLYLYGWCDDDATYIWSFPIGLAYTAKWALFRPVEVTK